MLGYKKPSTPEPIKMIYLKNLDTTKYTTKNDYMLKLKKNNINQKSKIKKGNEYLKGDYLLKRPSTAPQKDKTEKNKIKNNFNSQEIQNTALRRAPSPNVNNSKLKILSRPLSTSQKIEKTNLKMLTPFSNFDDYLGDLNREQYY